MEDYFRQTAKMVLSKVLNILTHDEIESGIQRTKSYDLGDLSFTTHSFSGQFNMKPEEFARIIKNNIERSGCIDERVISSIECVNGYVNFRYNQKTFSEHIINGVLNEKSDFGKNNSGQGKLVVVDYSSPNVGKPLHVGHIRSTIIGDSVIRLLEFSGYKTHGINYLGDAGLHIGKLLTAFERWGDIKSIESNPEKEFLDLYVRFGKEAKKDVSLEEEAKSIVKNIEEGDIKYADLLKKMEKASLESFQKVYDYLNIHFDEVTGQSHFSEKGKVIVKDALFKKIAEYSDARNIKNIDMEEEAIGAGVVVDLEKFGLPPKMILKSDGTAIYSTQDLGAAVSRYEQHKFDKMIYVVATEQSLYFNQIFSILKSLNYNFADRCHHLGFGLIHLQEGRMSTREGKIIFLEDLLEKAIEMGAKKIEDKDMLESEKRDISKIIGIGAVKYMFLQVDPVKEITFTWEKALDFDGNSAPYLQYTYARATRLLKKNAKKEYFFNGDDIESVVESDLVRKIADFPAIVKKATDEFKPNVVANYSYELAKRFNDLYNNVKIAGTITEDSKYALVEAMRITLNNASNLLGIKLPEKM